MRHARPAARQVKNTPANSTRSSIKSSRSIIFPFGVSLEPVWGYSRVDKARDFVGAAAELNVFEEKFFLDVAIASGARVAAGFRVDEESFAGG